MTARNEVTKLTWDSSTFPILCKKCLGTSQFIRMIKADYDSECKICKRPFTVFSWKPDKNSRYKRTEICQVCAKIKNVCQTCLFDLQFGLPVEIRDKFLKEKISIPKEIANRDFFTACCMKNIDKLDLPYDKPGAYPLLDKIAKDKLIQNKNHSETPENNPNNTDNSKETNANNQPTIKRNLPYICTFFLKGLCTRGAECPYRHEIPEITDTNEESNDGKKNNIMNRYTGVDDPVAKRILNEYNNEKLPNPPKDEKITTLYISGITDNSIKEKDVVSIFSKYGELKRVKLLLDKYCAYVSFCNREDAEKCIKDLHNKLTINMEKYRLTWAKMNISDFITDNPKKDSGSPADSTTNEYVTQCPLYNKSTNKNTIVKTEVIGGKNVTVVNLTSYDEGEKPYYATMSKGLKGGLLKKKRKFEDL